jgi:hypothetical protein
MFRVRKDQMEWFARKARRSFVERMEGYLREHFAASVDGMSPGDLSAWITEVVERAERHGVTTEPEVAQLLLLSLVLGADADETTPWVKEVLDDRELHGVGKVRLLVRRAREHRVTGIDDVVLAEHDEEAVA